MRKQKKIALILDTDLELSMEIVEGTKKYADSHDWTLYPMFYHQIGIMNELTDQHLDGVIGNFESNIKCIKNIPSVNISSLSLRKDMPSVLNDDYITGTSAAKHFLDNKLKNLYFIGHRTQMSSEKMLKGFKDTAQKYSTAIKVSPNFTLKNSHNIIKKWLETVPKPVGIFCSNHILAQIIVKASEGYVIPNEISLVTTAATKLDSLICGIELSTINADGVLVGQKAAASLDKAMSGTADITTQYVPPKKIDIRKSSSYMVGKDPKYAQAYTYMMNHFSDPSLNINSIAAHLGVSRRKMELIFKHESRLTPYQTITNERINHAKELLSTTNKKIIEIAELCGFSEQRQLSVSFKKATGLSPKKWRESKKTKHFSDVSTPQKQKG